MIYSNHNLRTNLQEWKNRLYRSTYQNFGHQLKYVLNNIDNNRQLSALISDAVNNYPISEDDLKKYYEQIDRSGDGVGFESEVDQASYCYLILNYIIQKLKDYNVHHYNIILGHDFEEIKTKIIEEYISPIIYYLHDKLDESNSTIFLLEKYKKRTEWFTKHNLIKLYNSVSKSYEKIFEDDLRLFLFDQGIDYPFSTPLTSSGRVDIIGEIETDDPLIIEIKIFDEEKNYGKNRIREGFTQIVKYANDYNKDVGFLIIFNMDNAELNFKINDDKAFPPSILFNNKKFYFIVVNCSESTSASKIGALKEVEITVDDLTKN